MQLSVISSIDTKFFYMHIFKSRDITYISIGQSCTNLIIFNVLCGSGHNINIGGLNKNDDEKDVIGLTVRKCTLTGTTNELRIKT